VHCGLVVACADDAGTRTALALAGVGATTYGTDPASDWRLEIERVGPEGARGRVHGPGGRTAELRLLVDGAHNLLDAAAAVATAAAVGVPPDAAAEALAGFRGVRRRFELRGSVRGARFYDDYGHVPTELAVTLGVARRAGSGRLVAVFQPHRYSRTQALWRELGASLTEADIVVITDVYGADQPPIPGVTGKLVVDGVAESAPGTRVIYLPHRQDVLTFLDDEVRDGDLVVTMGCGDVWMLGDAAIERMQEQAS